MFITVLIISKMFDNWQYQFLTKLFSDLVDWKYNKTIFILNSFVNYYFKKLKS